MSEEDTSGDVLSRGTTIIGSDSSAWGAIWDYNGIGCPAADFGAFGQFSQFGVSKQSSEWTIDLTALTPGCDYKVTITYQTSSGTLTTEEHQFTADKSTDILTGKVPQVDGVVTTFLSYNVTCGSP